MTDGAGCGVWEGRSAAEWREAWGIPELHVYDRIGSTNDAARALAEAGAPAGTTVLAEVQTAGRGRGGRRWHAPPGAALLLSIVLRPRVVHGREAAPGTIPLRVGLVVAREAERSAGLKLGLKWPNDIVAPDAGKVAGILCEGALAGDGAFLVAGIGINVNQRPEDFPPDVRPIATSLRLLSGREISRPALAGAIIEGLRSAADRDAAPLARDELREIARRDVLRGRTVTVDGEPRGTAVEIAPDGALLVRATDGRTTAVYSGTVRVLENAPTGRGETYP